MSVAHLCHEKNVSGLVLCWAMLEPEAKGKICALYTLIKMASYILNHVEKVNESPTTARRLNLLYANVKFEGKKKTSRNHSRETLQGPVQTKNTGPLLQKL